MDDDTPISVLEPLISQTELCELAGVDRQTVNNWIRHGYVRPGDLHDRRLRIQNRRFFSIVELTRTLIIGQAVSVGAMSPAAASDVADECVDLIEDAAYGAGIVSERTQLYLAISHENGEPTRTYFFKKPEEFVAYLADPFLFPDAQPYALPHTVCLLIPVTSLFRRAFLSAAELLKGEESA